MSDGLVICDIDGTIAHHSEDQRGHFDYHLVDGDAPIEPIIDLVRLLSREHPVVFMSGREDSCAQLTNDWLLKHVGWPYTGELYMRPTGDHRPDHEMKRVLYETCVAPRLVAYVLEDRNRNVALWRSLGLTCLQVADGDF